MTRVLVVDDHELFREGVVATLSGVDWVDEVRQAGSAAEALAKVSESAPDLVLLVLRITSPDWPGAVPLIVRPK